MMTIGARRGDWLRRVRAEMRGAQEETTPVIVRFSATDTRATHRPTLAVPSLEILPPAATLVPSGIESMMSTLRYAH